MLHLRRVRSRSRSRSKLESVVDLDLDLTLDFRDQAYKLVDKTCFSFSFCFRSRSIVQNVIN